MSKIPTTPNEQPPCPAIEVSDLVKEFRVYHRTYPSLKSHATALAKTLVQRGAHSGYETRRVLDGVTFEIAPGETVALIGRNGSGKSTLLSILSRIYLPTSGEARLRGRLISLLELGAGFDSELTGNQNVIFNGIILGLTEEEVAAQYDAILDFAGPAGADVFVRNAAPIGLCDRGLAGCRPAAGRRGPRSRRRRLSGKVFSQDGGV